MNTKQVLMDYYGSMHIASNDQIYKEAFDILSFAPVTFFKDLAKNINVKLGDVIKLFKDARVVKFFGFIKWSFKKLHALLREGFENAQQLQQAMMEYTKINKITRFTEEAIKGLVDFLDTHPKIKVMVGIGVAALLIYLWFVGFKGVDFNTVIAALKGGVSIGKILLSGSGAVIIKILVLTGVSLVFPWAGMALKAKFALDFIKKISSDIGARIRHASSYAVVSRFLKN